MSSSAPSAGVTGAFAVQQGPAQVKKATDLFSSDGFLKLLSAQMQFQNPMEPVKDTEFISQMAQMSQLEQVTKLASEMDTLNLSSQLGQATGMIGSSVTYADASGTPVTGIVQSVSIDRAAKAVKLGVGGATVDLAAVTSVQKA